MGLFDRLQTELPESARPLLPKRWSRLATATAAFGHGFAVQPLQGAAVVAGLLNGGHMMTPTLLKRSREEAMAMAQTIVKPETSEKMRYLFRLNATEGSASKADVIGYRVGGKTGTAEKVVNGRYSKDKRLASFIGAFPMDKPHYLILVMLDEPKATPETYGFATAGWNAVPTAGLDHRAHRADAGRGARLHARRPREARQAREASEEEGTEDHVTMTLGQLIAGDAPIPPGRRGLPSRASPPTAAR